MIIKYNKYEVFYVKLPPFILQDPEKSAISFQISWKPNKHIFNFFLKVLKISKISTEGSEHMHVYQKIFFSLLKF